MEKGSGIGAGGSALDLINVTRPGNLLSYSVNEKDEPKHSEVEASSYDRKKNERKAVTESTGLEGPKFVIRAPFQDEAEAKRAAKSKVKELVRAQADASFTIDGYPFAQAEAFVSASGIRSRVDGLWKVKTATHTFSASGPYTTELSCEVPSP
jgi:phage protein D